MSAGVKKKPDMHAFVLAAILAALIVVMSIVPYTGYISYGGLIEITTLHIVVIIGASFLGWKYGTFLGFVWGASCVVRAIVFSGIPAYVPFINPMVSLLPRMAVGFVAGILPGFLQKHRFGRVLSVALTAMAASLTNTVLVLSMYWLFTGMIESVSSVFELFRSILVTIIGVNGSIELAAAILICPAAHTALCKAMRNKFERRV